MTQPERYGNLQVCLPKVLGYPWGDLVEQAESALLASHVAHIADCLGDRDCDGRQDQAQVEEASGAFLGDTSGHRLWKAFSVKNN